MMKWFYIFYFFLIGQRIAELILAKKNENRLMKEGGREFGREHYPYIVFMHVLFFVSLFIEGYLNNGQPSPYWVFLFLTFFILQVGRIWVIVSLGRYWNTKIIIVPNGEPQLRGPYRYMRHPNYVLVALEFIIIPLIFQAYITAILFSVLNTVAMYIRIRNEERALSTWTNYNLVFCNHQRFWPKFSPKKISNFEKHFRK